MAMQFCKLCRGHWSYLGLVAALLFSGALANAQDGPRSVESARAQENSADSIPALIDRLKSESYATRQLAFWQLERAGEKAIENLEAACRESDADLTEKLIYLISRIAHEPESPPGARAYAALERIGDRGVTLQGVLAARSLDRIRSEQSELVEELLRVARAEFGTGIDPTLGLYGALQPQLKIDDQFEGTVADLAGLKWLRGVELVALEGERIDRQWLECVVAMPDVRVIQLSRTRLTGDDLMLLNDMKQLDALRITYSPKIDNSSIEVLGNLPIRKHLRLFGTQVTREGSERLADKLEGVTMEFGRGGFLGIKSGLDDVVISGLVAGGAAAEAGLKVNDRLIELNGTRLLKFDDLKGQLSYHSAGETVKITYERRNPDGTTKTDTVEVHLKEQTVDH